MKTSRVNLPYEKMLPLLLPLLLVTGCNRGQSGDSTQAHAEAASRSRVAYQRYENYLNDLPQTGITVTLCGPYKVASYDSSAFGKRVQELQAKIKGDSDLDGTDTTGDKGKLLTRLASDSKTVNPYNTALAINRKTESDLISYIKAYGMNAVQSPDIASAVTKLKGFKAYTELTKSTPLTIGQDVDRVFSGSGDTGTVSNIPT